MKLIPLLLSLIMILTKGYDERVVCREVNSCVNMRYTCPSGTCIIRCLETNSCSNGKIMVKNDADTIVRCIGNNSCTDIKIYCYGSCKMDCSIIL